MARRSPYQNLNKIILILAETKRDGGDTRDGANSATFLFPCFKGTV